MKTRQELNEEFLTLTELDRTELVDINAGDSLFFDLGVAVGSGIVKGLRWLGSLDSECQCYY